MALFLRVYGIIATHQHDEYIDSSDTLKLNYLFRKIISYIWFTFFSYLNLRNFTSEVKSKFT